MANKYDNLFVSGVKPEIQANRPYATIAFLDGTSFEGCNEYQIFWVGAKPYGAYGTETWGKIYHGPHTHKYPEIFVHLGTDPEHPYDLGAEVEMFMGPEMEKHIVTRSTAICIPAGFVHGPWRILKVTRPFMLVTINQAGKHTEKAMKNLVSTDDLKRMIFIDQGYESDKVVMHWPEEAGPRTQY